MKKVITLVATIICLSFAKHPKASIALASKSEFTTKVNDPANPYNLACGYNYSPSGGPQFYVNWGSQYGGGPSAPVMITFQNNVITANYGTGGGVTFYGLMPSPGSYNQFSFNVQGVGLENVVFSFDPSTYKCKILTINGAPVQG
jgi:hypothetical protein